MLGGAQGHWLLLGLMIGICTDVFNPGTQAASWFSACERASVCVCLFNAGFVSSSLCEDMITFAKDEKKRIVPIIHASDGCHAILPSSMPSTHGSAGNQGHGGLELLTAEVIRLREELKDCKQRLLVPYGL